MKTFYKFFLKKFEVLWQKKTVTNFTFVLG